MAEKIITLCFLLGSLAYLFMAQKFTFGTLDSPKSGFLPALAGIMGIILSLTLLINQWRPQKAPEKDAINWTKFVCIIIGLLFYITILNIIGYFAATFIFLFYLFKLADMAGWLLPFTLAAISSSLFYLLFEYYLAVPLP